MKKVFLYPFILIALVAVTSCATNITKLNTSGSHTYKINTVGVSRDIQTDALNKASNLCRSMNKDYRFVRNIILPKSVMGMDLVSYSLIFSCVEPGSPQEPPPLAAIESIPEDLSSPETLPESEEDEITDQDIPATVKNVATIKPLAYKHRKSGIIGDTPGAPESLGDPPSSKQLELENEDGDIIEEAIFE